mmetsp:Transcript_36189/g.56693  ORF Transcript_36189/g.56693 Transcript_36189/m.56693 type:complete len:90 (-) Transcript_36189:66-335(-)
MGTHFREEDLVPLSPNLTGSLGMLLSVVALLSKGEEFVDVRLEAGSEEEGVRVEEGRGGVFVVVVVGSSDSDGIGVVVVGVIVGEGGGE